MSHSLSVFKHTQNTISTLKHVITPNQANIFSRFISWCHRQEKDKMLWLTLSYLGMIGMVLPCTLMAILFWGDNNFDLVATAAIVNVPVLALNLAAQGTKITLPVFFFALLVNVSIILYSFVWFLYH